MATSVLDTLNPKQREAVEYCGGHELVLAGAGSGKTRVLTAKIAYLIDEKKIPPRKILALTFTNKAACEMRGRVEKLLGENLRGMRASTFHSYGLRFLRRYPEAVAALGYPPDFIVFDRDDCRKVVKKILSGLGTDPKIMDAGGALDLISRTKNEANPVTGEPYIDPRRLGLYDGYQKALLRQGAVDFDDLLILPLRILASNKAVRGHERESLDWVLVDEYQDVNRAQYLILRCLVEGGRKIMVVGDPDQSIYGWRGADMTMIMNFASDFKGAKVVVLDQNYRSTGNILEGANGVIQKNAGRPEKKLWTVSDRGDRISVLRAKSDLDESAWVAGKIEEMAEEGYGYSEFAVLYRMNALSRGVEQALIERGIPYRVIRGLAFYERMEVKDVLSMLRLAVNPMDTLSLYRVANVPARGVGKKSAEVLEKYIGSLPDKTPRLVWKEIAESGAGLKGKPAAGAKELAGNMLGILEVSDDAAEAVNTILYDQGYDDWLEANYPENREEKRENVLELLSLVNGGQDILELLTEVPLMTDQDEAGADGDSVSLLTLHAAKGLEYPVVFIVGMEEGIFPTARAVSGDGDMAEERRLCYVGMTRARERLFMSGAGGRLLFGSIMRNPSSRFIREIPCDCVEINDETYGGTYYADSRAHRRRWRW